MNLVIPFGFLFILFFSCSSNNVDVVEEQLMFSTSWDWPVPSSNRFKNIDDSSVMILARKGAHVLAPEGGEVFYMGEDVDDLGQVLILLHDDGLYSIFGNIQYRDFELSQKVHQGEVIGLVKTEVEFEKSPDDRKSILRIGDSVQGTLLFKVSKEPSLKL